MAVAAGLACTPTGMGTAARLAGLAGVAGAAGRLGLLGPGRAAATCGSRARIAPAHGSPVRSPARFFACADPGRGTVQARAELGNLVRRTGFSLSRPCRRGGSA